MRSAVGRRMFSSAASINDTLKVGVVYVLCILMQQEAHASPAVALTCGTPPVNPARGFCRHLQTCGRRIRGSPWRDSTVVSGCCTWALRTAARYAFWVLATHTGNPEHTQATTLWAGP